MKACRHIERVFASNDPIRLQRGGHNDMTFRSRGQQTTSFPSQLARCLALDFLFCCWKSAIPFALVSELFFFTMSEFSGHTRDCVAHKRDTRLLVLRRSLLIPVAAHSLELLSRLRATARILWSSWKKKTEISKKNTPGRRLCNLK